MPKIVVFTQRVEIVESYGERRDCADQRISKFLTKCGFIPIPLPNDSIVAREIIESIEPCGIVLTGGNSLVKYGGNAPEKDLVDKTLIALSIEKRIPLLGFCRGMESIFDYFNVNLEKIDGHIATKHEIFDNKGNKLIVNSYHNYACKHNSCLDIDSLYKSKDGVIEMMQHKDYPIIGLMWHPEREIHYSTKDIKIFKDLFGGKR